MTDQTAKLDWRDGVPIATAFDDPYYSLQDGLAETQHVFLGGNNIATRFGGDFQIAELGFGTGLNLLVTWAAWDQGGRQGNVRYTSFEAFAMSLPEMAKALGPFTSLAPYTQKFLHTWTPDAGPVTLTDGFVLDVITGDARQTVPAWDRMADAWYLDGFSPAKNPELWEPSLLHAVGAHTKAGGTAATYSAAGHIRRSLQDAGFEVTRTAGYGRKRHMTCARMHDAE